MKVFEGFSGKSIEAFVPRIQVMSRRKDRRKKILIPLLPGYVFVHFDMTPRSTGISSKPPVWFAW